MTAIGIYDTPKPPPLTVSNDVTATGILLETGRCLTESCVIRMAERSGFCENLAKTFYLRGQTGTVIYGIWNWALGLCGGKASVT